MPWTRAAATSTWYIADAGGGWRRSTASRWTTPVKRPAAEARLDVILYGDDGSRSGCRYRHSAGSTNGCETTFEGVIPNLERRYHETDSDYVRSEIERYMAAIPARTCNGARLKPEALAVTVGGQNIVEVTGMDRRRGAGVDRRCWRGPDTPLNEREQTIAQQILKEIRERLTSWSMSASTT